ncbi:MAG: flavodoxin [Longibaculum muris]|uniref:flavodoxin n=1 Tax=Longibaculum muris TaxID=1796628 RepID=UPI002E767F66|nr:flavodoxin [Longibaculum muris]MED9812739.1 flavodoxin [Longibaculum muris]
MKLKKKLTIFLSGVIALALLVGCQSNKMSQTNDQANEQQQSDNEVSNSLGKTLIVYYSATGNTKEVADMIAKETDGTLFEIEPKNPYSDEDLNYSDDNSRVTREYNNENARNIELISTTVDNWDSYDTVFIGYPIWWGIAARPIDNFIKDNDFSDKTVIPFCTSSSSGLGDSGELLEQMAGSGNWKEGQRFNSGVSSSDVQNWLNELK